MRGHMSSRSANAHLKWWRDRLAPAGGIPQTWAADLTDDDHFEWQRYLGSHPVAKEIISGGIVGFWVVVLPTPDPNLDNNRVDFVVRLACAATPGVQLDRLREGYDSVRLHPGSAKHGAPLFGRIADWVPPEVLAQYFPDAPGRAEPWQGPGTAECTRDFRGYFGSHDIDRLGENRPTQWPHHFLAEAYAQWYERPHPRGLFCRELTYEEPQPFRFDMALPHSLRLRGVWMVWLVWDPERECPAILFRMIDETYILASYNRGRLNYTDGIDIDKLDWR